MVSRAQRPTRIHSSSWEAISAIMVDRSDLLNNYRSLLSSRGLLSGSRYHTLDTYLKSYCSLEPDQQRCLSFFRQLPNAGTRKSQQGRASRRKRQTPRKISGSSTRTIQACPTWSTSSLPQPTIGKRRTGVLKPCGLFLAIFLMPSKI